MVSISRKCSGDCERTELEWNWRFSRPKGLQPSQLLRKSCVDRTSFTWDHVKLERRTPPGALSTFLPKGHVRDMKIQSVCHLFHCQRCLFWLNFWPFHANWLQSLFVRVRRLSKVCEQQPVPSSSYSKFWKFLKNDESWFHVSVENTF